MSRRRKPSLGLTCVSIAKHEDSASQAMPIAEMAHRAGKAQGPECTAGWRLAARSTERRAVRRRLPPQCRPWSPRSASAAPA